MKKTNDTFYGFLFRPSKSVRIPDEAAGEGMPSGRGKAGGRRLKALVQMLALSAAVCLASMVFPVGASGATLESKAGLVSTSSGRLHVRSGPSTASAVVSSLQKGGYVTLLSRSGSWWQVEYAKGKYGYSHADYIKTISSNAAAVQVQSGNLHVRSGAGTSYAIIDKLARGEAVVVLSQAGDWSRVLYHGTRVGYVSSRYLSSTGSHSVALGLPNFKQTDSRWAQYTIANTGKTIAQIGCATTAVAMMESYRTGETIYPDAMSRRLSYTSSGSLYWPSHYQPVFESSGYLTSVYHLLRQGKPVLLGAKTSAGKQHWVVITGYNGGASLTASGFTIHDPGSNSRTNLQQFLNAYPVFYKYFYYK